MSSAPNEEPDPIRTAKVLGAISLFLVGLGIALSSRWGPFLGPLFIFAVVVAACLRHIWQRRAKHRALEATGETTSNRRTKKSNPLGVRQSIAAILLMTGGAFAVGLMTVSSCARLDRLIFGPDIYAVAAVSLLYIWRWKATTRAADAVVETALILLMAGPASFLALFVGDVLRNGFCWHF